MKTVGQWLNTNRGGDEKKPSKQRKARPANTKKGGAPRKRHANQKEPRAVSRAPGKRSGLSVYPIGGFEQVGRNCFVV